MDFDHGRRSPAGLIRIRYAFRLRHWSAKRPFGGPGQVLGYLGRYTHRVALSNERLLNVQDSEVTFQWKDYRSKEKQKSRVMTLSADEFIRRFLIHVLPRGYQRIRFFGILAHRHRKARLARCRELLAAPHVPPPPPEDHRSPQPELTEESIRRCPVCGKGRMIRVQTIAPVP
jgi:hypothetical protein